MNQPKGDNINGKHMIICSDRFLKTILGAMYYLKAIEAFQFWDKREFHNEVIKELEEVLGEAYYHQPAEFWLVKGKAKQEACKALKNALAKESLGK